MSNKSLFVNQDNQDQKCNSITDSLEKIKNKIKQKKQVKKYNMQSKRSIKKKVRFGRQVKSSAKN